jgi:quercetin dioxygenase-like cupin family protein
MEITRNSLETGQGPSDWFTGTVFIDPVAAPSSDSRIGAAAVHFTPGARTAWHTHPHGQTIWVTEGVGLCQREGGAIEVIRPGDRVFFGPGEVHWHGAAPTRFMTHIAMQRADDEDTVVTWGAHVSDEDYGRRRRSAAIRRASDGRDSEAVAHHRRRSRYGRRLRAGRVGRRRCRLEPRVATRAPSRPPSATIAASLAFNDRDEEER